MKLTAFKYGTTEITEKMAFSGGSENVKIPIGLLFFLIETENKKILVDVGCDTMPGFTLFSHKSPVEVLEDYGVKRDDITDVILTHAHHDHIDCVKYYKNAEIHIHKKEIDEGRMYLEGLKTDAMDSDTEIADGVIFKEVGGHSAGSGIVLVTIRKKIYALLGDECYTKENLLTKRITGCSACPEKSQKFTEEFTKPEYNTIVFHDPDLVREIGYKEIDNG